MTQREKAKELFEQSGLPSTPINWHIWKRAFDLGVRYGEAENETYELLNIEIEGFIFKYNEAGNHSICYTKPYENHPRGYQDYFIDLIYNSKNNWVLICQGDNETPWSDWYTMFAGQISNQNELKKILKAVQWTPLKTNT